MEPISSVGPCARGDLTYVDNPDKLSGSNLSEVVSSELTGFVHQVHARQIGELAVVLGAGRAKRTLVDHGVGIVVHCKVGDQVAIGDPLFTIHAADQNGIEMARSELLQATLIKPEPINPLPVFYGTLE